MTDTSTTPGGAGRRPRWQWALIVATIAIGLIISGLFVVRSVRSFRELQYIRTQGFDRGTASVDAIKPWMTIRFVAVAYAVPEEYLYSALAIPFDRRNANTSLGELNRIYERGLVEGGSELVVVDQARAAIRDYRANPVVTGLRDVRPWMSVRYIANSTGVPADEILAAAGLPAEANQYKPIEMLADELAYPGGGRALAEALQRALPERKALP